MSARTQERQPATEQYCSIECDCGKKIGTYFRHYDVARCSCGRAWWALQPKRNGPLALSIWPGPNLTRAEMEGKTA